jgi:kynurenine formamidase
MVTYRGLPPPNISDFMGREESEGKYAPGTQFHIGRIDMVANTGTYIDSPFHRFPDGADLSELPLRQLANLPGRVIRVPFERSRRVDFDSFKELDVRGKAILIHTGWDRHWGSSRYFYSHPFLTRLAAQILSNEGAALVGIDSLNIDDTGDGARPAHTILLSNRIPVLEHLCNLSALPDSGFRFFAVPVKVRRMGSFPVRAFAILDK